MRTAVARLPLRERRGAGVTIAIRSGRDTLSPMRSGLRSVLSACFVLTVYACSSAPAEPNVPLDEGQGNEQSVKPGISPNFLDPKLDVDEWVKRFEAESREVFAKRAQVARACGLRPGMTVADVGAGTGVYVDFFAKDVGTGGHVYAVEISHKFIEHLDQHIAARKLTQVQTVLCTDRDVSLPEASTDVVFTSDTYHHFEYPSATLASIHRALKPGGTFVVVDFERIPGVSREWLLGHVRCGKEQVIREVTDAGFELVEEVPLGFSENYFLRFRRR